MSYSTVLDVRSICDTDLTDAEITNVITWVDEVIDMKLNSGALSATFLEMLSATYAAYRCYLKDPNARALGEYSERRDITLKMLRDEVDDMMAMAGGGLSFTPAVETLA